jgi:hypothetical protein
MPSRYAQTQDQILKGLNGDDVDISKSGRSVGLLAGQAFSMIRDICLFAIVAYAMVQPWVSESIFAYLRAVGIMKQ